MPIRARTISIVIVLAFCTSPNHLSYAQGSRPISIDYAGVSVEIPDSFTPVDTYALYTNQIEGMFKKVDATGAPVKFMPYPTIAIDFRRPGEIDCTSSDSCQLSYNKEYKNLYGERQDVRVSSVKSFLRASTGVVVQVSVEFVVEGKPILATVLLLPQSGGYQEIRYTDVNTESQQRERDLQVLRSSFQVSEVPLTNLTSIRVAPADLFVKRTSLVDIALYILVAATLGGSIFYYIGSQETGKRRP